METAVQQEMVNLVRISWIVLIPVGVLLALVLYKLLMLLIGLVDLLSVARHELTPAMKDTRLLVEHAEYLGSRAVTSVKAVEERVEATRPALARGAQGLKTVGTDLKDSLGALWSGIRRSFQ